MKIHVNLFLGKVFSIASQLHLFLSLFLSFFLSFFFFFLTLMSFVFQCFSFFIPGTRLNNPQSVFNSSCFKESLNFLAFSSLSFFFSFFFSWFAAFVKLWIFNHFTLLSIPSQSLYESCCESHSFFFFFSVREERGRLLLSHSFHPHIFGVGRRWSSAGEATTAY